MAESDFHHYLIDLKRLDNGISGVYTAIKQATFIYGSKSDTYLIFLTVTSVRTGM